MQIDFNLPPSYSTVLESILERQKRLLQNPFFEKITKNELDIAEAKSLASMQLGYNTHFIEALALMRNNFCEHQDFIIEFLDPHFVTEFGADLEIVELSQKGVTHIKMIYELLDSLDMSTEEKLNWGDACCTFFKDALKDIIGGKNKAEALGALFADEIYANTWFSVFHKAFEKVKEKEPKINIEFFRSHAEEIEPAHQDHAVLLLGICKKLKLPLNEFANGVDKFEKEMDKLFTSMC